MPATPANVVADSILRDTLQCTVQRLDAQHRVAPVLLEARPWVQHVPRPGQSGVVELQDETGIYDRPIFLTHRAGDRLEEGLSVRVVAVLGAAEHLQAAGSDGGDERLFDAG